MDTLGTILLVEDNEDDIFLMQRAFSKAAIPNPIQVVRTGQDAISYLNGVGSFKDRQKYPLPIIVLLDVKLPLKSGPEVLRYIREQPELRKMIVVMLTSSNQEKDIKLAYATGANSYLVKPPTGPALHQMMSDFQNYWLRHNLFA